MAFNPPCQRQGHISGDGFAWYRVTAKIDQTFNELTVVHGITFLAGSNNTILDMCEKCTDYISYETDIRLSKVNRIVN